MIHWRMIQQNRRLNELALIHPAEGFVIAP